MSEKTQGERELDQIDQLVRYYIQSGNRQVLTQIRRATTVMLKRNPGMKIRLEEEVFSKHQLSAEGIVS